MNAARRTPAQPNDFSAARGREAGETAADRVPVACREVIDDAEGIALLDARRKHIGVAEPVLRKRVPRALWGDLAAGSGGGMCDRSGCCDRFGSRR